MNSKLSANFHHPRPLIFRASLRLFSVRLKCSVWESPLARLTYSEQYERKVRSAVLQGYDPREPQFPTGLGANRSARSAGTVIRAGMVALRCWAKKKVRRGCDGPSAVRSDRYGVWGRRSRPFRLLGFGVRAEIKHPPRRVGRQYIL
jgi:hypothetical protein